MTVKSIRSSVAAPGRVAHMPRDPVLYKLTQDYARINNLVEACEGDVTDWPLMLKEALDALPGQIEERSIGCCKFIAILEGEAEMCREEEKRIADRRRMREKLIEETKKWIGTCMDEAGIEKISTPLFTLRMQTNVHSVPDNSIDRELLPPEFLEPVYRVNKKAIIEEFKKHQPPSGEPVQAIPGATVIRTRSVRIS